MPNLIATPLATGAPFNWRDTTQVSMQAPGRFVLWVDEEAPYKRPKGDVGTVKSQSDNNFKIGGAGSKQEHQIVSTVNNPIEAQLHWRAGELERFASRTMKSRHSWPGSNTANGWPNASNWTAC